MRIDYTNVRTVPVLVIFVRHEDKYLLLKRSNKVLIYQNLWSNVSGFLDEKKTPEEKVAEEITQELGLKPEDIKNIRHVETYTFSDKEVGKDWVRNLYLVDVSNPNITLDFEHTQYRWIAPSEISSYETTPGLPADLEKARHV